MQLYSVLQKIDYEGFDLMAVFASRKEAEEFCKVQPGYLAQWAGYSYGVVESTLGQPVDSFNEFEEV